MQIKDFFMKKYNTDVHKSEGVPPNCIYRLNKYAILL